MTGKTIQTIIAISVIIVILHFGFVIYYPSFKEGRIHGKTSEAIEAMLHYALQRDANPESRSYSTSIDPFTGRPFVVIEDDKQNDNRRWYMISPGPDKVIDMNLADGVQMKEYVPYDPTNGVVSSGDILFGSDLTPGLRNYLSTRQGNWEGTYYGFERR